MSILSVKGRRMLEALGVPLAGDAPEGIVVGFSGGADSAALLHFLTSDMLLGARITALHINHMLRGDEAERDERFCRDFCSEHGIAFEAVHINIAEISGGVAVEETARNERYAALADCARRHGAKYIALAHTETDNAETLIFNIVRGSGLRGACGIPASRPCGDFTIIRPLLSCTRAQTEEYCRENGIEYVTDATNSDTHYTRNFIRHEILPRLRRINPAADDSLGSLCSLLSCDSDFIEGEAQRFFASLADRRTVPIAALTSLHEAVRTRVLARMYHAAGGGDIDSLHIRAVCDIMCGGAGKKTELPCGIFAVATGDSITFMTRAELEKITGSKALDIPLVLGENRFGNSLIFVSHEPDAAAEARYGDYSVHFVKSFCLNENAALSARTAQPTDSYRAGGITRKIKKLRTELSFSARNKRPVICAGGEVIWYPGFDMCDALKGEKPSVYIYYFEK